MVLSRELKASAIPEELLDQEEESEFERQRRQRRWPFLLFLLAIALVVLWITPSQQQHIREMLVRQQVQQIRVALMLYRARFNEAPSSLKVLADARFIDPRSGMAIPYLEGVRFNRDGRMVDPMGYPYDYDAQQSLVRSTAPCCSKW